MSIEDVAQQVSRVAVAITADVSPGHDETGSAVACLTEAVMGVTAGLVRIAESIQNLADAVAELGDRK